MKHLICLFVLTLSFTVNAETTQTIDVEQKGDSVIVKSCHNGADCTVSEVAMGDDVEQAVSDLTETINEACEDECDVVETLTPVEKAKKGIQETSKKVKRKMKKVKRDTIAMYHVSRKIVLALYYYHVKGNKAAGAILMY